MRRESRTLPANRKHTKDGALDSDFLLRLSDTPYIDRQLLVVITQIFYVQQFAEFVRVFEAWN